MIVRRIVLAVVALAALSASTFVIVFAAAFGLYALLREALTPAGAAGVIALGAALLAAAVAFVAARQAKLPVFKPKLKTPNPPPLNPIDRVVAVARERPFVAAGAAVAAGLLAVANPALVTAVMRAMISPRPPKR